MGIADELREYVEKQIKWLDASKVHYNKLLSIAGRIDAEHERQLEVLYHDMSDAEYIKLPVDMDGEPIHVGDRMVPNGMDMGFKVRRMHFNGEWSLDLEGFGISQTCPDMCHHHKPTVEDVLREFADEMNQNLGMYTGEAIDADEWRSADNKTIAEFAAKLRLADDGEEQ